MWLWKRVACGTEIWPDADIIMPGSSFGPALRAVAQAYYGAGVSEEVMRVLLDALENASFSAACGVAGAATSQGAFAYGLRPHGMRRLPPRRGRPVLA